MCYIHCVFIVFYVVVPLHVQRCSIVAVSSLENERCKITYLHGSKLRPADPGAFATYSRCHQPQANMKKWSWNKTLALSNKKSLHADCTKTLQRQPRGLFQSSSLLMPYMLKTSASSWCLIAIGDYCSMNLHISLTWISSNIITCRNIFWMEPRGSSWIAISTRYPIMLWSKLFGYSNCANWSQSLTWLLEHREFPAATTQPQPPGFCSGLQSLNESINACRV